MPVRLVDAPVSGHWTIVSLLEEEGTEVGRNDDSFIALSCPHQGSCRHDCEAGVEDRVGGGVKLEDELFAEGICFLGLDKVCQASRGRGEGGEGNKVRTEQEGVSHHVILPFYVYYLGEVILS